MLMHRPNSIEDERGTTLVELLVAISAGLVIFFGLTMLVLASMHNTTRVSNRVHTTQNARTAVQAIVAELHSACMTRFLAPIQEGSSGTTLRFIHAYGSSVSPTPILSVITLSGTTLKQSDYAVSSGSAPRWEFNTSTPTSSRALISGVGSPSSSTPIFSYYKFKSGQVEAARVKGSGSGESLVAEQAEEVSKVNVAVKASPPGTTVADANGAATVQDSALLRFTPPVYSTTAANLPCE